MIFTRRFLNGALIAGAFAGIAMAAPLVPAWANNTAVPFSAEAFKAAQASGSPILVEIHADWCPTCKAQNPILDKLTSAEKFKDLKFGDAALAVLDETTIERRITPEEDARVLRKIDRWVMPIIILVYFLQQLDKYDSIFAQICKY